MPTSISARSANFPSVSVKYDAIGDWPVFVVAFLVIGLLLVAMATVLPIGPGPFDPTALVYP